MEAVAHSPAFAKKAGVPQSVGKDFSTADKGRKFGKGGEMKKGYAEGGMPMVNKGGKMVPSFAADGVGKMAKGGMAESKAMVGKEVAFMKKKGAPAAMVKHEKAEMKGFAKGGRIVTKKEMEAAGFDNLRDFLNNEKGLTRRGESGRRLPVRSEGEDADIKGQPMSFKEKNISLTRVSPSPKASSENKEELSDMTYKRGGMAKTVKKYAKGGSIDGCAVRGKTKATMVKMNMGGKAC
jgi:hypothetical protein